MSLRACTRESRTSWCVFDLAGKGREIQTLEAQTAAAEFWTNPTQTQEVMRKVGRLRGEAQPWREMEAKASELVNLAELAQAEGDDSLLPELDAETAALQARLQGLEFRLLLGDEHDSRNAILAVHAGAGGTESQDWAEMLLRMYLRWAERRGFSAQVLDTSPGEQAGIKSTVIDIKGEYAYGYLKVERGVHRLVRLSPFDAAHARHTSFALVEVMPEVESDMEVQLNPEDLEVQAFRSSGHGGQNVQKVSTAIRIIHKPTGMVVTCQTQRSQLQNKEAALRLLRARLMEQERQRKAEEHARLKGQHVSAGWGNQIRSYVLHPYKMVKDHRTEHETGNAAAVLDGDLDAFMEAALQAAVGTL
ncbi:MAG: peptide chain release factor 2 [Chloroflexi bacterium]|nr:peptide chain release factor 2 [Chloroflexota bacterium]